MPGRHDSRNSQGESIHRHVPDIGETAVINLLTPASLIKIHCFDPVRILKISNVWIVESYVSVFSYANTCNIQ